MHDLIYAFRQVPGAQNTPLSVAHSDPPCTVGARHISPGGLHVLAGEN